jgi:hypothetical protein
MPNLSVVNPNLPAGIAPEMGRVNVAVATFGVSRSWIYRQAANSPALLRKLAGATLVDFNMLRAILADLPPARVGAKRQPQERA